MAYFPLVPTPFLMDSTYKAASSARHRAGKPSVCKKSTSIITSSNKLHGYDRTHISWIGIRNRIQHFLLHPNTDSAFIGLIPNPVQKASNLNSNPNLNPDQHIRVAEVYRLLVMHFTLSEYSSLDDIFYYSLDLFYLLDIFTYARSRTQLRCKMSSNVGLFVKAHNKYQDSRFNSNSM